MKPVSNQLTKLVETSTNREKKKMDTEKALRKVITEHLLREGKDARAIEYVLNNYDLTCYLLEAPLKIITEQVTRVSKAVEI